MSSISSQNPLLHIDPNPIYKADQGLGNVIFWGSSLVLDPINHLINGVVDTMKNIKIEGHEHYYNETPTLFQSIKQTHRAFLIYHKKIFKSSSEWARDIELAAEKITKCCLFLITFSRIGQAIQRVVAEKIIGKIALGVSFCAFQIFHFLPYIIIDVAVMGGFLIHHLAPVPMNTFFHGTTLLILVYLIFRMVKELEVTNRILDQTSKILDQRLDVITLFKNTCLNIIKNPFSLFIPFLFTGVTVGLVYRLSVK